MTDAGLVSVIVPAYNCADTIPLALDSALAQTYRDLEVVVVDDGSTDGTAGVLAAYGDRIRVVRQDNRGVAAARNRGIDEARGGFLAFLDADDLWLPEKLRRQVDHLARHPEAGLVYHRWRRWSSADEPLEDVLAAVRRESGAAGIDADKSGWIYPELLLDCIVHTTTAVVRREVLERVGGFAEGLPKGEDWDLWLRISRVTEMHKLSAVLSLYRIHGESTTTRAFAVNYADRVIGGALERWGTSGPDGRSVDPARLRDARVAHWFGYGYGHYWAGDLTLATRAFGRVLRLHPTYWPGWRYLLRSLARRAWPRAARRHRTAGAD